MDDGKSSYSARGFLLPTQKPNDPTLTRNPPYLWGGWSLARFKVDGEDVPGASEKALMMQRCRCGHHRVQHENLLGSCNKRMTTHHRVGVAVGLPCYCRRFKRLEEGEVPEVRFIKEDTDAES